MARSLSVLAAVVLGVAPPAHAQETREPGPPTAQGATMADVAVLALFERVCMRGQDGPTEFEQVEWSSFPDALRFMNTYDHGGTFLRGEVEGRTLYLARTQGEGHLDPGTERRCGAAVQGADYDIVVGAMAERTGGEPVGPIEMGGQSNMLFMTDAGAFSVSRVADGWVIVRTFDMALRMRR